MHPEPGHWVHKECRRIYCNPQQIEKDSRTLENEQPSCDSPTLRSGSSAFLSNEQCLFCGQIIKRDTKKRGRDIHDVTELSMAKEIERICNLRNDEWGEKVRFRLKSMNHDLPAADAVYHQACSTSFRTYRQIPSVFQSDDNIQIKKPRGRLFNPTQFSAF